MNLAFLTRSFWSVWRAVDYENRLATKEITRRVSHCEHANILYACGTGDNELGSDVSAVDLDGF